jgi:hypothetical protein
MNYKTSDAAKEYNNGNYNFALEIYRQLGKVFGEALFEANIELCKKRISIKFEKKDLREFGSGVFCEDAKSIISPSEDLPRRHKKNESTFILNDAGIKALSENKPLWHSIKVFPGQSLIISLATSYINTNGILDKKAISLFKFLDQKGELVDFPLGKLSKSQNFNAYFKYLPSTEGEVKEFYSFKVPTGVAFIKLGLCAFNNIKSEQVFISNLSVRVKQDEAAVFEPPSPFVAEISTLGWPDYPPNGKPYVIGVMDEFTTGCFEEDVNLIQPRPDNWYALAEKYTPALFFIESAWKGNSGSWQYRVADYANKPGNEVAHICQYARQKGIPTLFWNKEDPVHHEKFMCSAKLVDHIFTTDANMRDSYVAKTDNTNVHTLPFAAQPALHKPSPLAGRKPRACFAGSWYGNRHEERGSAMQWLLRAANPFGLDIYDRNHGTGTFPFPEEYQSGIKGSLPYKQLCDEYSRYRVFLNVNSVTDSPTMFSRRVFELMACGTPVVSTYAKGIEDLFESNTVWLVNSQEEADEALHTLMTDDAEWRRRSLAGIREVFAKHTYAHRLNDIFEKLGLPTRLPTEPAIRLAAKVQTLGELKAIEQFAKEQAYAPFKIGVESPAAVLKQSSIQSEKLVLLEPGQLASWLASELNTTKAAGWLSPACHYGRDYLRDLANATLYVPQARGWAKSCDADHFACNKPALLSGAVWQVDHFIKEHLRPSLFSKLSGPELYVLDSDQFFYAADTHVAHVGV